MKVIRQIIVWLCDQSQNSMLGLTLALALALNASAANDSIPERKGQKDPWYLMVFGGANHSMSENLDENFKHSFGISGQSIGTGALIGLGREWTPTWGWRGVLSYNSNKGRADFYNKDEDVYAFHSVELNADVTMDFMDLFAPKRKWRRFNIKAFLGVGAYQTFGFEKRVLNCYTEYSNNPRLNWGFRGGITARYHISQDACISVELSHSCMDDHFSGCAANFPLDMRQNLSIGIIWVFNPKTKIPTKRELIQMEAAAKAAIKPVVNTVVVFKKPDAEDVKHRSIEGRAFLDFPVNKTAIYADYRKNPSELRKIIESIDVVKRNNTITINSIDIHGYASPEGNYSNNQYLAQGRAEALKKYLLGMYNFAPSIISVTATPEDWEGLKVAVENNYDGSNKEAVLAVIGNTSLPEDRREFEMSKVLGPVAYKNMVANIYPGLRHSDYSVNYTVRNYTLDEAKLLITKRPDLLSLNEMYRVAQAYPRKSYKYVEAMTIAARQYPDNAVANLNAANASLETSHLDDAKYYLDRAGDLPEAIHARGVLAALQENYTEAEKLLKQSYSIGVKESADVIPNLIQSTK